MGLWQSLFCLVCVIDSIDAIAGAIHGCLCYAISGGPVPPVNLPVVPQMYRLVDVHLDMFSFAAGIVLGLFGFNRALLSFGRPCVAKSVAGRARPP